jgi:hypothetical protein
MAFKKDPMDRQIKDIEFSKLKFAYVTIKIFLENESCEKVDNLKTRIAEDLSLLGDDNYDLLVKFVKKFELDYSDFQYDKHFYSEGELFGSEAALYNLLTLSVWLPLKAIEILTFNNVIIKKPGFHKPSRNVSDMTFKDFVTWYIEGKYATGMDIEYRIKNKSAV